MNRKPMVKNVPSSNWTALRNGNFRAIWFAAVISGTCAFAHRTAATWAMNELNRSALFLSMMSTCSSLPFFLFTLPAGALADMVDRGKLVAIMQIWLAAVAAGIAILGRLHMVNTYLILLFVLLMGTGIALNAPAFSSLLTDVVSEKELASASILTGLQFDLSAIVGSALAGAVIPLIGTDSLFAVNSATFLLVGLALLWWGRSKEQADKVMENFFQSFATAVRYVRYAPGMQVVLARQALFSVLVAAVPALLPVVGLKELHIGAAKLGLLYTSMGIGSVVAAAFILPWGRAHYSPNTLTRLATYLLALVILVLAFVRQSQLLLVISGFAGVAWTSAGLELWLAGQRVMPAWARGRMNAIVIMFSQGATALGGVVYGTTAQMWGVTPVLMAVAGLIVILLLTLQLFSFPLSIDFAKELSIDASELRKPRSG
jgi:MFS family permease